MFYPPETFEERAAKVDEVTAADVRRVAAQTFRKERLLTSVVGHLDRAGHRQFEQIIRSAASLPD